MEFNKQKVIAAAVLGAAVMVALGFVPGKGALIRAAVATAAAYVAAPIAASVSGAA